MNPQQYMTKNLLFTKQDWWIAQHSANNGPRFIVSVKAGTTFIHPPAYGSVDSDSITDWGDGTQTIGREASHTYAKDGTFTIICSGNPNTVSPCATGRQAIKQAIIGSTLVSGSTWRLVDLSRSNSIESIDLSQSDLSKSRLSVDSCPNLIDFKSPIRIREEYSLQETGLIKLPSQYVQQPTEIYSLAGVLAYCKNLVEIPSTFLRNVTSCSNLEGMCREDTALQRVALDAFNGFPEYTVFADLFSGCSSLVEAPKLWEMYPYADSLGCYYGCTSLPFYDEIPRSWR